MTIKPVKHLSLLAASALSLVSWSASSAQQAPVPGVGGALMPTAQTGGVTDYPGKRPRPYPRLSGPETLNPGAWPLHWPYPDQYDSTAAATEVHHLRYVDDKIRFVEVAYFAQSRGQMHGHPYASVFGIDAPAPKAINERIDPDRAPIVGHANAPAGTEWPVCNIMGPESPHAENNLDTWPHHFYRAEFVRLDGKDLGANWKTWYPRMAAPTVVTKGPLNTTDPILVAPNNYRLLWESDHIRFVEVMLRPGETEPPHTDPYPAILAIDAVDAGPQAAVDKVIDTKSPLSAKGDQYAAGPKNFESLTCGSVAPRGLHQMTNPGKTPIHYYRMEFKRVDGPALKDNWRKWYPWMSHLADESMKSPVRPNY